MRLKQGILGLGDEPMDESEKNVEVTDVSDYQTEKIHNLILFSIFNSKLILLKNGRLSHFLLLINNFTDL